VTTFVSSQKLSAGFISLSLDGTSSLAAAWQLLRHAFWWAGRLAGFITCYLRYRLLLSLLDRLGPTEFELNEYLTSPNPISHLGDKEKLFLGRGPLQGCQIFLDKMYQMAVIDSKSISSHSIIYPNWFLL
jgi:hypothetical protein